MVGRDPATDLVALRLKDLPRSHVAARASAEAARVGCLVLAVGRPGRDPTASFGIISAVGEGWRTAQGARVDRVLRLDLAVYDGFSGGPLVDPAGAVIGLNNSALARGAPLALPAAVVDRVLDELLERGHVRRPFIGVAVQPVALSATVAAKHRPGQDTALLVMSVADGSPSETAGLMVGDALLAANGQSLRRPTDLIDALSALPSGGAVDFTLLRGGAVQTVSLLPADRGGTPS
jgi:S1-C subfamily serine protease